MFHPGTGGPNADVHKVGGGSVVGEPLTVEAEGTRRGSRTEAAKSNVDASRTWSCEPPPWWSVAIDRSHPTSSPTVTPADAVRYLEGVGAHRIEEADLS